MTTQTSASADDENEALFWLHMAKRILAGEIAPDDMRVVLNASASERATPGGQQPAATRH